MPNKYRNFERGSQNRDTKSIYLFCEGRVTEHNYFNAFSRQNSRIVVHKFHPEDNNMPLGLLNMAKNCCIGQNTEYDYQEDDGVWIVFDTDKDKLNSRKKQIEQVYLECQNLGWHTGHSNPCFEVWLYNHIWNTPACFTNFDKCKSWKAHLNNKIGGFDTRKITLSGLIQATTNAKNNFISLYISIIIKILFLVLSLLIL